MVSEVFLPFTNVLGFEACRITSKILGIGTVECSCVYVNTIKSGKMSVIIRNESEKQRIFYTYACIDSARIERTHSDCNINNSSPIHVWNVNDEVFGHQLENWFVDNFSIIYENIVENL